jgi:hypothetical protein
MVHDLVPLYPEWVHPRHARAHGAKYRMVEVGATSMVNPRFTGDVSRRRSAPTARIHRGPGVDRPVLRGTA